MMSRAGKAIGWLGMALAVAMLLAHVVRYDRLRVDWITLALIGILVSIPLLDSVRRIKIGQIEAEIDPREIAEVRALSTAAEIGAEDDDVGPEPELYASIIDLVHQDPTLGLAKLRIELEQLLKSLYILAEPQQANRRISSKRLVDEVVANGLVPIEWSTPLRDVLALAGRAIHGERIRTEDAEDLALVGVRLLGELRDGYNERIASPVETREVDPDLVQRLRASRYRVTTIATDDTPKLNVYALSREALDDFLGGYDDQAEFLVTIERLEPEPSTKKNAAAPAATTQALTVGGASDLRTDSVRPSG